MNDRARKKAVQNKDYSDLWNRPGHLIRRLHQIHVAMFLEECREFNMTPVQFGVLTVLCQQGISDIVSIGRRLGVDRITVANVLRRLERRNLVKRPLNSVDKRRKLAQVTKQGRTLVDAVQPAMIRAQRRFVHPLDSDEQAMLDKLLSKLLLTNNEASRAPLK
tara:strand:- start:1538 stop:2026 length:489 start_codon:yes stop_codon:yes gene_type:complete